MNEYVVITEVISKSGVEREQLMTKVKADGFGYENGAAMFYKGEKLIALFSRVVSVIKTN